MFKRALQKYVIGDIRVTVLSDIKNKIQGTLATVAFTLICLRISHLTRRLK